MGMGIGLILTSLLVVSVLTAFVTNWVLSARLTRLFGSQRSSAVDHVIVCSLGTVGYRVLQELRTHLARDRARTKAFQVSDLGLIEMTRQRVRQSHLQSMTEACPTCHGTGRVFTAETVTATGTALMLIIGGLHVLQGALTVGQLLVVVSYLAAIYDPLHYLALLEHKSRALDQAAPLAGWQLPECFAHLRRLLEARLAKHASREYIQVLRLLETFALGEVAGAVEDALHLGTISFDAVRHLLLCRVEHRPSRLDLANWPHLPTANVRTTQAADYLALLTCPPVSPLVAGSEATL